MADAEPLPNPKGLLTQELGETGLRGARPYEGTLYEEFLPQLRGWAGARKFREMAENDPVVGAFLWALEMLVRGVKWRLVAPKDAGDKGEELKTWYEEVLLKEMKTSFVDTVIEALSMLTFGYALLEIKLAKRPDGKGLGVEKLAPRSQETIWRWFFDAVGEVRGFEQWRVAGSNARVPIEKCLHFTTTSRRANPEGRSVLRNAYITYERKQANEIAEGRRLNRSAGIVKMRVPGKYLDPQADANDKMIRASYQSLLDKIARDGSGGVLLPSDRDATSNEFLVELDYLTIDASKTAEAGAVVDRANKLIAMTVLADFILLGHEAVGSYALGATKSSLFDRATQAILSRIAQPFNQTLIPLLADLNGHDKMLVPELVPGNLSAPDLAVLGDFITKVTGAGMPLFPSENGQVEEALLSAADLPNVGLDKKAQQVEDKKMDQALHAPLPGEPGSKEAELAARTQQATTPVAKALRRLLRRE